MLSPPPPSLPPSQPPSPPPPMLPPPPSPPLPSPPPPNPPPPNPPPPSPSLSPQRPLPLSPLPSPPQTPTETIVITLTASGSVSDYSESDKSSLRQKFVTIAGVDISAVTISLAAASLRITVTIVVPSASVASVQNALLATLSSVAAASEQLGIMIETVPTVKLASPPSPPLTPPPPVLAPLPPPATSLPPLLPLLPHPETEAGTGNRTKVPDKPEGNLEATLNATGLVVLAVLAACCCLFVARTRLKKEEDDCWGPTSAPIFVASASGCSGTSVSSKSDPPNATTAQVDVPLSDAAAGMGVMLEATAHSRARVQLLTAAGRDGAYDAPPWSALVVDGVTVPYEEVARLKTDISALEFIVEQLPRTLAVTGVRGGPRMHHLRMSSRAEFDLWRKALFPKIVDPEEVSDERMLGFARDTARKWLTKTEAEVGDAFLDASIFHRV